MASFLPRFTLYATVHQCGSSLSFELRIPAMSQTRCSSWQFGNAIGHLVC